LHQGNAVGQAGWGFVGGTPVPTYPRLVSGLTGLTVIDMGAGDDFSILLTTTGRVYTMGGNGHGQVRPTSSSDSFSFH